MLTRYLYRVLTSDPSISSATPTASQVPIYLPIYLPTYLLQILNNIVTNVISSSVLLSLSLSIFRINSMYHAPTTYELCIYICLLFLIPFTHYTLLTIPLGSWSIINVKGQSRLLIPKVATGVKQWHLRKESDFYPKAHFNFLMNSIPDGAEVQ